jgi:DNA invertase Pin-like site-specific DNA recombinase
LAAADFPEFARTGGKGEGSARGKQPKLKPNQAKHLLELYDLGTYSVAELAELFGVGRSTVYRTIERLRPIRPEPERAAHSPGLLWLRCLG